MRLSDALENENILTGTLRSLFAVAEYFIKSKTMRKEKTEMAVEIFCKQTDMDFMEKIRAIEHVDDVTLIQYNGEYHG